MIALVRHGQTEWSASGRHTSTTDIPLTTVGEDQARTVPATLATLGIRPAVVWTSPRLRAARTATLAGLTVDAVQDDLAEWNYGAYEGRTTADIRTQRPDWDLFRDGCPDGESPAQISARADRVLALATTTAVDGDLVLVCHGHMSRVLAARWVALPVTAAASIAMDPAAVTVLGTQHAAPIILHANVPAPH